jgi:hypothetical protein
MWTILPALALVQHGSSLSFGTDPTEPLTRFEIAYDHDKLPNGDVIDRATARFDLAIADRFVVRVDVPYAYVSPEGADSDQGLSDVRAQIGWRAYTDPTFSIFFGGGVVFDSAAADDLGSGQKQIVPMVAASGALPEIRSRLHETIEHFVSYDSDGARTGIALTKIDLHLMTEWSPTTWTQAGGEYFVDWKGGEQTGLNLDVEFGKSLGEGFVFWVKPGAGVFGKDVPGVVDWNVVVGVRWEF